MVHHPGERYLHIRPHNPFPEPPALQVGEAARRTLIVYNDALTDESVTASWEIKLDGKPIGGEERQLTIELGCHTEFEIEFTPETAGALELRLASSKGGAEQFTDTRRFVVK